LALSLRCDGRVRHNSSESLTTVESHSFTPGRKAAIEVNERNVNRFIRNAAVFDLIILTGYCGEVFSLRGLMCSLTKWVTLAEAALNSQERRIAEAITIKDRERTGNRLCLSAIVESVTSFYSPARNPFFRFSRSTPQHTNNDDNIGSRM
jgi:hypothetical protein